jgi:phosphate transport system substrate-binding protein
MKKLMLILLAFLAISSCQNGKKSNSGGLSGAGATFPMPFYNQAIGEYTAKTGVKISYGGIGSGGGIKSLKD